MHRRAADDESDCLVLSYHYVRGRSEAFPRLPALNPTHFEAQVAALLRDRRSVDHASFLDAVDRRRPVPGRTFLLTFDDGLVDHYATVFPILRAHGIAGVFFVSAAGAEARPRVLNVQKAQLLLARMGGAAFAEEVRAGLASLGCPMVVAPPRPGMYRYDSPADVQVKHLLNYELPFESADPLLDALFAKHIGREDECARGLYLNESMIREMSGAGMIFGFHTWNHRVLSRLSPDAQRAELEGGAEWIRSLTGQSTVPFCYPHGHAHAYNADTVRILGETGYSSAFTAVRRAVDPARDHRFELPRFDTRDVPGGAPPAAGARRHAASPEAESGARGAML